MRRIIEGAVAVVVVVLLSCEVGCAKPEPKFALPPPPTVTVDTKATEEATAKLKGDVADLWNAYTEAAKAQMREKLCPKP